MDRRAQKTLTHLAGTVSLPTLVFTHIHIFVEFTVQMCC